MVFNGTEQMNTPLKKARLSRELTLERVAELVGSDSGNISRIERAKQIPNRELAAKLVDLFRENGITEVHLFYPERFNEE